MFAIRRRALPGTLAALVLTGLVLTAGVVTAPAAYAAPTSTKMVCATLDQTTTELGPTNASLYLPKFDPALGTLLSVDITAVELEVISSTTLTNTASNTSRFKFSSVLDWTLSLPGGDVIGDQVQLLSTGLVLVSLAPGASLPLGPTDALSPLTVPSITGAAMDDYVGTCTISYAVLLPPAPAGSTAPNTVTVVGRAGALTTDAALASATVTYLAASTNSSSSTTSSSNTTTTTTTTASSSTTTSSEDLPATGADSVPALWLGGGLVGFGLLLVLFGRRRRA